MSKAKIDGKEYDLANAQQRLAYWNAVAARTLKGRTIADAFYAQDESLGIVLALRLDNGTELWVMADDEGNGPGAIHGATKDGKNITLPVVY